MTVLQRSLVLPYIDNRFDSNVAVESKVLITARQQLGEILSAFEFFDKEALQLTLSEIPEAQNPLPDASNQFNVVIETAGSNANHDAAKLQASLFPDKSIAEVKDSCIVICLPKQLTDPFTLWTLPVLDFL